MLGGVVTATGAACTITFEEYFMLFGTLHSLMGIIDLLPVGGAIHVLIKFPHVPVFLIMNLTTFESVASPQ